MCPRCGYDLTGLIATWTEACPLGATCSECGLEFDCGRALGANLLGPRWSYEHGLRRSARRWWATSFVVPRPFKLCRELGVDHEVRAARLVRFALLWLLGLHLFAFAITFGFSMASGIGLPSGGWRYAFDRGPFWEMVGRYLIFPYRGQMAIPTGVSSSVHVPIGPLFLIVYLPTLLMPAWMMLLGASLRMARVRKVHLVRGLAYALPGAAAWLVLTTICIVVTVQLRSFFSADSSLIAAGVMLLWLMYHLVWWYIFIRRYLRLRHAAAVVGLNTVMTVLVFMIVVVLVQLAGVRW